MHAILTFIVGAVTGYFVGKSVREEHGKSSQSKVKDIGRGRCNRNRKPAYPSSESFDDCRNGMSIDIHLPVVTSSDFKQEQEGNVSELPSLHGEKTISDEKSINVESRSPSQESKSSECDGVDSAHKTSESRIAEENLPSKAGGLAEVAPGENDAIPCHEENKAVASLLDAVSDYVNSFESSDNEFSAYLQKELSSICAEFAELRFSGRKTDMGSEDGEIWFRLAKRIGSFLEELDSLLLKGGADRAAISDAVNGIRKIMLSNGASLIDVDAGFDSLRHRNAEFFFVPTGTMISETVSSGLIANGQVIKKAVVRVKGVKE